MHDANTLPEPTPEVLETLRLAEKVASDEASQAVFRRLREMLEQPKRPTATEAAAELSGEGTLTARAVILADGAVATDDIAVTKVSSSRSTTWDTLESVSSSRSTTWDTEAARKTRDYAVLIAKWGGSALLIEKIINGAIDIVSNWKATTGR